MAKKNTEKERKGFTYYRSFRDAVCELSIEERLQIFEAITDYALDGIEPDMAQMSCAVRMAWKLIRPYLEADRIRWQNGCKGGANSESMIGNQNARQYPKQTENKPKTDRKQTENKPSPFNNVNVNEDVNVNGDSKGREKSRFTPPTIEEVKQYFVDNGYRVDAAERAYKYYSDGNWCDSEGKQVRSWKQKMVAVWFKPENATNSPTPEAPRRKDPVYM